MNALLMDKPDPGNLFSNISQLFSEENLTISKSKINKHISMINTSQVFINEGKEVVLNYIEKFLDQDDEMCWYIVADVQKSQSDILEQSLILHYPINLWKY